jgi:D-alanyl-lipoteichoic acid acyltransferase DltB (MBOAT superfamily)
MSFNSLQFLVFFPAVLLLYFATPHRHRWVLLLIASYYFYGCWKVEYLFLLAASTLIDYVAGILIEQSADRRKRRLFLALSLSSNLGILFAFKYAVFVNESLRASFNAFNIFYPAPAFDVLLPVGLSFYTFQTMSYAIDVYRGKKRAERHLGIFALYVSFFPQLVAGPIERSTHLLPQFRETHLFDWDNFRNGFFLALWGFFKKIVIADRLAVYVDAVYDHPADHTGAPVILASVFFAVQIYCDFSAYSDIAKGTAQMMGFRLMDNFRRPFAARSMREFWQRWHISLTKWIMDYLYAPLARKARAKWHGYLITFFVFAILGLWHGAAWHFVWFGVFVGLGLVVGDVTKAARKRVTDILFPARSAVLQAVHRGLQMVVTSGLFVCAGILFRANNLGDVGTLLSNMFINLRLSPGAFLLPELPPYEMSLALFALATLGIVEWLQERRPVFEGFASRPLWAQCALSYGLIYSILMFGEFSLKPFIYFQF